MGSTGLYVHAPFCVRKCNYCDFCSVGIRDNDFDISRMVDCLIKELNNSCFGERISTVFIGGGTPSILPVEQIERLLIAIRGVLDSDHDSGNDCEFTIECNPGTVDEDKLRLYKEYGVNRISFGLQSANDNELRMLGRIHTYEEFLESYRLARRVGFDNINIDIITAVPGQTKDSLSHTLDEVIKLEPEHISAYSLIIEEGTPFYDKYRDAPPIDEETDRSFFEMTHGRLTEAGYVHYEVSNYAKQVKNKTVESDKTIDVCKNECNLNKHDQAFVCKHNLNYWNRGNYIGIGPAASSHMDGVRKTNTNDLYKYMDYIEREQDPADETEKLDATQQLTEAIYLGLRTADGISFDELSREFGENIRDLITGGSNNDSYTNNNTYKKLSEDGYFICDDDRIRLTPSGWWISDTIVSELIKMI